MSIARSWRTTATASLRLTGEEIDLLVEEAFTVHDGATSTMSVTILGSDGEVLAQRSRPVADYRAAREAQEVAELAFEFGDPRERLVERAMASAVTFGDRSAASRCVVRPGGGALFRGSSVIGAIGIGGADPTHAAAAARAVIALWHEQQVARS